MDGGRKLGPTMTIFSPADRKRYQRELMKKGWAVNQKLTDVLAGKNVTLATTKLPHEMKPGLKPEEKLRIFLDQIMRAQKRLQTPDFGNCVQCQEPFPKGAIDDTAWLETCTDCLRDEDNWL
jgi:hypothetical protein